jgi:hypothetical protein
MRAGSYLCRNDSWLKGGRFAVVEFADSGSARKEVAHLTGIGLCRRVVACCVMVMLMAGRGAGQDKARWQLART